MKLNVKSIKKKISMGYACASFLFFFTLWPFLVFVAKKKKRERESVEKKKKREKNVKRKLSLVVTRKNWKEGVWCFLSELSCMNYSYMVILEHDLLTTCLVLVLNFARNVDEKAGKKKKNRKKKDLVQIAREKKRRENEKENEKKKRKQATEVHWYGKAKRGIYRSNCITTCSMNAGRYRDV